MRIIAGTLKGRAFDSPATNRTHPMSDKIRGALFNALGPLDGLTVLDAFAGSGALSLEAVSRGATQVTAIDIDKAAFNTMYANVVQLGLTDRATVLRKNINSWSRSNPDKQFDVVLCDPPYNDIRPDVLQRLTAQVAPGGLYVLSWPGKEPIRPLAGLEPLSHKTYGDAQLIIYRRPG